MSPSPAACDLSVAATYQSISEAAMTQMLVAVGFTCPFLLPSFLIKRSARRLKFRRFDQSAHFRPSKPQLSAGVHYGGGTLNKSWDKRETQIDLMHRPWWFPGVETAAACANNSSLLSASPLHFSFLPCRANAVQQRQFSSTAKTCTRASPRESPRASSRESPRASSRESPRASSRESPRASSRESPRASANRRLPVSSSIVRPNGHSQLDSRSSASRQPRSRGESKHGATFSASRQPKSRGESKHGATRSSSSVKSVNSSSVYKPLVSRKTSDGSSVNANVPTRLSISRPNFTSSPLQKPKPSPKWVRAGVSRTKLKVTGRGARRRAKKTKQAHHQQKKNIVETDETVEIESMRDVKVNKPKSVPSFNSEAYEAAVLQGDGSWKKILAAATPPSKAVIAKKVREAPTKREGTVKSVQSNKTGIKTSVNSRKERQHTKQTSGIVDKGQEAQDELLLSVGSRISVRGNGRIERLEGRGRKIMGTTFIAPVLPIDGVRKFATSATLAVRDGDTTFGGAESDGREKLDEVKAPPLEDSEIPKPQFSQAEHSPILEDPQHSEALANSDHAVKPNNPIVQDTEKLNDDTIRPNINKHSPKNDRSSEPQSQSEIANHLSADCSSIYERPKTGGNKASALDSPPKSGAPRVTFTRSRSGSIGQKDTPSPSSNIPFKSQSPLLTRILSSPNIEDWYKRKLPFWMDILQDWFLPRDLRLKTQNIPIDKIATIGGKAKRTLGESIFSRQYPSPVLPKLHKTLGASPIDFIELLEESRRNGIDLLFALAKKGEYSAIRWIVRRILHPQVEDIRELQNGGGGDVLGSFSWVNEETTGTADIGEAENFQVRASDVRLGQLSIRSENIAKISKAERLNTRLARQGLGLVLGSIGTMLVHADPSTLTHPSTTPFFSHSHSLVNEYSNSQGLSSELKINKKGDYTVLLPISKELLAYLHNCSLVPSTLYSLALNPRLSILKTRILTGLADTVWRHQELATSKAEAEDKGLRNEDSRAFTVPEFGWRLHGYWRGGFETLTGDYPQWQRFWKGAQSEARQDNAIQVPQSKNDELLKLAEMGNRGEREVLLELVLRVCTLAGYGHAGALILSHIAAQGGWSWIDYAGTWPEEYRLEDLTLREESESTDGLPGQWGVRGYAVVPPPVRTIPRSLPRELVSDIAVAVVDGVAEGRRLRQVISDLDLLGTMYSKEQARLPPLISRVVSIWEDEYGKVADMHIGELVLHFIQRWSDVLDTAPNSISPGAVSAELQVWYKVLQNYINLQNIDGTKRVWGRLEKRLRLLMPKNDAPILSEPGSLEYTQELNQREATHYFHPPWVLGSLLTIYNQNRRITTGLSLLSPQGQSPFPIIPKHYYHLPPLTPPLLVLATWSRNINLLNEIISALPFNHPGGVPHSTLTSIMNAYLRFGDFTSSQEVIAYLRAKGLTIDGVDIGVLVENTLRRDIGEGYRFVEQTVKKGLEVDAIENVPPNLRVRSEWGNWHLPFQAAAGKGSREFTISEGQRIATQPTTNAKEVPPRMSPSGWLSVLNHAIESDDRTRTEWALKALGVDLRERKSMSTKVFNILLKGVVMRSGAKLGWDMMMEHCIRDYEIGKPKVFAVVEMPDSSWMRTTGRGREWEWVRRGKYRFGVRADVITFKTVLDEAVREKDRLRIKEKEEWKRYHENGGWERKDAQLSQGQSSVELLVGLLDKGTKSGAEELKEWKMGVEERARQKKEMEEIIQWCRERLMTMGGL